MGSSVDPFNLLMAVADRISSDIGGDWDADGRGPIDTGYDLWVEELDGRRVGVIDMGDLYQGVYWYEGDSWDIAPGFGDPQDVIDRIIAKRESGDGW